MRIPEMAAARTSTQRGFTLAEAVIVIVITGIVAGIVAMFIRTPVQGYMDSVARAELTDAADTALRRMTRDIRLALPNSVRITNVGSVVYIEFLLTKTGGRYLAEDDNPSDPVATPFLSFDSAGAGPTFTVVGGLPAGGEGIVPGVDSIVVYNLGPGQAPADAYTGGNIAAITGVAAANNVVTLSSNPFAAQNPTLSSPAKRFFVVEGPVTYACDPAAGTLRRFWRYPVSAAQPSNAGASPLANGQTALLARGVVGCAFQYNDFSTQRIGLISLRLMMQTPGTTSGIVDLFHQVHVDNIP